MQYFTYPELEWTSPIRVWRTCIDDMWCKVGRSKFQNRIPNVVYMKLKWWRSQKTLGPPERLQWQRRTDIALLYMRIEFSTEQISDPYPGETVIIFSKTEPVDLFGEKGVLLTKSIIDPALQNNITIPQCQSMLYLSYCTVVARHPGRTVFSDIQHTEYYYIIWADEECMMVSYCLSWPL